MPEPSREAIEAFIEAYFHHEGRHLDAVGVGMAAAYPIIRRDVAREIAADVRAEASAHRRAVEAWEREGKVGARPKGGSAFQIADWIERGYGGDCTCGLPPDQPMSHAPHCALSSASEGAR
jgi:hypothetical protein